jgi:hypothetical protein
VVAGAVNPSRGKGECACINLPLDVTASPYFEVVGVEAGGVVDGWKDVCGRLTAKVGPRDLIVVVDQTKVVRSGAR